MNSVPPNPKQILNPSDSSTDNDYPSKIAIRPESEMWRDSCGTGFIASKSPERSKEILSFARDALITMELRGGCCADGRTGDGAGMLIEIDPKVIGCKDSDGVGMLFLPQDPEAAKKAREIISNIISEYSDNNSGLQINGWREVPVRQEYLGELAHKTQPHISQVFLQRPPGISDENFEQVLYKINRSCAAAFTKNGIAGASIASLSSRVITYKALTNSADLFGFYLDIAKQSSYQTRFAIMHRRQATNETTDWQRVHPNTLTAHNGEINAIRGNTECMVGREAGLGLPPGELITASGVTDSFRFDLALAGLMYRTDLGKEKPSTRISSLIALLIPGADRKSDIADRLADAWDGPAAIIFTDGKYEIGAALDRNGLRPLHYQETDKFVMAASEAGVFNFKNTEFTKKGRLGAGEGVRFDLISGDCLVSYEANAESAGLFTGNSANTIILDEVSLFDAAQRDEISDAAIVPKEHLKFMQKLFGYTDEDIKEHLHSMIAEGKEALGGMGYTARIAGLSNLPRSFFDYIVHEFAQVSNPPWDYLREKNVADTAVYVGKQPNIFLKNEIEHIAPAIKLRSPVLSIVQMEKLKILMNGQSAIKSTTLCTFFSRTLKTQGLNARIDTLVNEAEAAVDAGCSNLILSDRSASFDNPPIPSALILGAIRKRLLEKGKRMHTSLIVETGEVKTAHDLAVLISYGAKAVCPYNALAEARHREYGTKYGPAIQTASGREDALVKSLENGLLKIMSKMGISVARSYIGSGQHFPVGLSDEVAALLGSARSPIKGITFDELAHDILKRSETPKSDKLEKGGLWRELSAFAGYSFNYLKSFWSTLPDSEKTGRWKKEPVEPVGEPHHMTTEISHSIRNIIHEIRLSNESLQVAAKKYHELMQGLVPVSIRDYLSIKKSASAITLDKVQSANEITAAFSVGQMSYGSLSEVAHRDAMLGARHAGAKSGSGEGGQNPYYYKSGIAPSSQQAASGMFGVDAYYLNRGNSEINIKMAQGAKPGEGGQLMGIKVSKEIGQARGGRPGATMISPPPLHDKYSIEDLARSIREYKQINPQAQIAVKLVASPNIGTIAAGVTKCGANVIEIAGFDGGTGASPLTSMAHAGLPCEYGISEANRVLIAEGLRSKVKLRVSGGLRSAQDVVKLAILGADEFDFGRLPLVAEGCFMMRQCHENVCTAGIATQDPAKIAKYLNESGENPEVIVTKAEESNLAMDVSNLFQILAENVRQTLCNLGISNLRDLRGRLDLLETNPVYSDYLCSRGVDLSGFYGPALDVPEIETPPVNHFNMLNLQINKKVENTFRAVMDDASFQSTPISFNISNQDSSAFTAISGEMARDVHKRFKTYIESLPAQQRSHLGPESIKDFFAKGALNFEVTGTAGQGFAMGLCHGLNVTLRGEANDAVAQNMSGGTLILKPEEGVCFDAYISPIIGQSAMYGARGGKLFALGIAGDRFAVRNSGAEAVIEGCKKHGCEYMINGAVAVLGEIGNNFGAGMSGGIAFLYPKNDRKVNKDTITSKPVEGEDLQCLKTLLSSHYQATASVTAKNELDYIDQHGETRMLAYVAYSDINKATQNNTTPTANAA